MSGTGMAMSVLMTMTRATTIAATACVTPASPARSPAPLVPLALGGALLTFTTRVVPAPLAVGAAAQRVEPTAVCAMVPATAAAAAAVACVAATSGWRGDGSRSIRRGQPLRGRPAHTGGRPHRPARGGGGW